MRCRIVFTLTLMHIFLLLLPGKAGACSCIERTPCEAFGSSSAVFIGRTIGGTEKRGEYTKNGRTLSYEAGQVLFAVEEVFKGVTTTEVTVASYKSICDDHTFARGERYLVYAMRSQAGGLSIGICSITKHIDEAKEDLEFLRNAPKEGTGGRLYGEVALDEEAEEKRTPFPGVTLIIEDETHHRTEVKTDKEGHFEAAGLKPGKYTVRPILPEHHVPRAKYLEVVINDRGCTRAPFWITIDGRISGKITDFNMRPAPVELELVSVDEPEEKYRGDTDGDGQYEIKGVPPGRYVLKTALIAADKEEPYYHPGVGDEPKATVIKLGMGQKLTGYDFQLPPKLQVRSVQGIARYSDGRAAANVEVRFFPRRDVKASAYRAHDIHFRTMTDQAGRFTLLGYKDVAYEIILFDDINTAFQEKRPPGRSKEIKLTLTKDIVDMEIVLTLGNPNVGASGSQKKKSAP